MNQSVIKLGYGNRIMSRIWNVVNFRQSFLVKMVWNVEQSKGGWRRNKIWGVNKNINK